MTQPQVLTMLQPLQICPLFLLSCPPLPGALLCTKTTVGGVTFVAILHFNRFGFQQASLPTNGGLL
jgi:hypothetical protein